MPHTMLKLSRAVHAVGGPHGDAYMGSVASALKSHIHMKAQPERASKTVPETLRGQGVKPLP